MTQARRRRPTPEQAAWILKVFGVDISLYSDEENPEKTVPQANQLVTRSESQLHGLSAAGPRPVQLAQIVMPVDPGLPPVATDVPDPLPLETERALNKSLSRAGRRAAQIGSDVVHGRIGDALGRALLGQPFPPSVDDPIPPPMRPLPGTTPDLEAGLTHGNITVRPEDSRPHILPDPVQPVVPHIMESKPPPVPVPAGNVVISPTSRQHILLGDPNDPTKGGHRSGRKGKTDFPQSWTDDEVVEAIDAVANDPASKRAVAPNGYTVVDGIYQGVDIRVAVKPSGECASGYPTNLARNP